MKTEPQFSDPVYALLGFYLRYLELVTGDHVVILTAAFRAMTMEGRDDEFMFALPALSFRVDIVDFEDAILNLRVFNCRRPAVEKILGDDSGRLPYRQRAFADLGKVLFDHEFLKGID